eukprot:356375-Chlamydomonas_euryale.AAC.12
MPVCLPALQAFIKLESLPSIPADKQLQYGDLAMSIFLKNTPADPRAVRETSGASMRPGAKVNNPAYEGLLDDLTGAKDVVCVASGRLVTKDMPQLRCKTCKHVMIAAEVRMQVACPLCHALLPPPGDKAREGTLPKASSARHGAPSAGAYGHSGGASKGMGGIQEEPDY